MGWKPTYAIIAERIRRQITEGQLTPGSQLPSERELCDEHAVSATTIRRALAELKNLGLLESHQGRGVFVREGRRPLIRYAPHRFWPQDHPQASYYREAETAGRSVDVMAESVRTTASERVAEWLGIEVGDAVVQVTYRITMDGQPVSSSVCWEVARITDGTAIADPTSGPHAGAGLVARYAAIGRPITGIAEVISARMPSTAEAQTLDIPSGTPLFVIEQTAHTASGPVQVSEIAIPADRYRLSYDMPMPSPTEE
ncbi:GntR family transcriptional regulator [Marinactinospora thermotolerans]|uniref:GntR family transcriptional regulator n=1 Tax=Marinactinospora thermotolerans DSM 45154 TaxID=1122192 RepID=A0A1T4SWU6_9ACTN|nr:GntR family transcriptional regulator [Marinactinospora thermotolerans]SKA32637.1 GntR family transcriptional regulator [Marinactinospora thermotolerans DSM 45154]